MRIEKWINLLVLQVNDRFLLEVNAEIAKLSICPLSGHFFHENFTDFDRVFSVSDENGTYNDRESYVLDPKLTLTFNALRRKVPICTESEKNTQPVAQVGKKIPSAFSRVFFFFFFFFFFLFPPLFHVITNKNTQLQCIFMISSLILSFILLKAFITYYKYV